MWVHYPSACRLLGNRTASAHPAEEPAEEPGSALQPEGQRRLSPLLGRFLQTWVKIRAAADSIRSFGLPEASSSGFGDKAENQGEEPLQRADKGPRTRPSARPPARPGSLLLP